MKYLHILCIGLFLIVAGSWSEASAQLRPSNRSTSGGGFNPLGGNSNNPFGGNTPGGPGSFQFANPDSTGADSTKKPKVKPNTRLLDRRALFIHLPYSTRYRANFTKIHEWEELEGVDGFVQSLGQTGKPYQILYHGLNDRFFDQSNFYNPIMGRYNRYVVNPEEQVIYFDTHTPYVRVNYRQGARELQVTDVTMSQNITPFWNSVFYLKRRQSEGAYRDFVTDHYNLYLSNNFHTKNNRYHLFFNGTFNQLNDQINGGVPRANQDGLYPTTTSGLIPDLQTANQRILYNSSFFKQNRATSLAGASGIKIIRSLYADHYFHLLGVNDSVEKANKLSLRNQILLENSYQRFGDNGITNATLANNLIPVLPTLVTGGDTISESFTYNRFMFSGEASYTLQNKKGYRIHFDGGLKYGRYTFANDSISLEQNSTDQFVRGDITMPWLKAEAKINQRFSNLFDAATSLSIKGSIFPILSDKGFKHKGENIAPADTLSSNIPVNKANKGKDAEEPEKFKPIVLGVEYQVKNVNPSFFQKYFVGVQDNRFRGNGTLENQQINHLSIGLTYHQPAAIIKGDTLLPNYYGINGFLSRTGNLVYYSDSMEVRQAADGQALTWIGAEAKIRQRFLRNLYLESSVTVQNGSVEGDIPLQLYSQSIPTFYGRASVFFERSNIKIAKRLRIGMELEYNTTFAGQSVDPISGEYFPTPYLVPSSPRAHAFFILHPPRSHTYVWFRYQHVNELFPYAGYYTTPFYPMIERSFSFGVSWTFFD